MSAAPQPRLIPKLGQPFAPWNVFARPEERYRAVNDWRKRTGTPWSAAQALLYLFDRAARNCSCWPHLEVIARDMGLSENQARRIVNYLKTGGAVRVERRGPRGNEYVVLWHEAYEEALRPVVASARKPRPKAPAKPTTMMVDIEDAKTYHHDDGFPAPVLFREKPTVDENPNQSTPEPPRTEQAPPELIDRREPIPISPKPPLPTTAPTDEGQVPPTPGKPALVEHLPTTAPTDEGQVPPTPGKPALVKHRRTNQGFTPKFQEEREIAHARNQFEPWEWKEVTQAIQQFEVVRPGMGQPDRPVEVTDLLVARVLLAGKGVRADEITNFLVGDRLQMYLRDNPSSWPQREGWFVKVTEKQFKFFEPFEKTSAKLHAPHDPDEVEAPAATAVEDEAQMQAFNEALARGFRGFNDYQEVTR